MPTSKALATTSYTFDIVLRQSEVSDEDCDALYRAGCDDATISTCEGVTRVGFDREASSLEQAIESATADVRAAGFEIAGIEMDAPEPVSSK